MTKDMNGKTPSARYDIAIAGGGIVALCAALALRRAAGSGARLALVAESVAGAPADGRAFAIAPSGKGLLDELGVWSRLVDEAESVTDIAITDSRLDDQVRQTLLSFGANDASVGGPLAYMVPAAPLQHALAQVAESADIARIDGYVDEIDVSGGLPRLTLGETVIESALLVGADGARSLCRESAGIGWIGWEYPQLGLTTTVAHERDHHGLAYEHFLPGGPFAILPLRHRRSSIVWTEDKTEARRLLALGHDALAAEIERRFGHRLGRLRLEGPVVSYPLRFGVARSFVGSRMALVGDAAHVIHPIAGQGLNLGLRDVAALAEAVGEAMALGLEPGARHTLASYERARRFDTAAMGAATDGLNRLFSNDATPLRALRDLGLGLVDRMPALKRAFLARAAGIADFRRTD